LTKKSLPVRYEKIRRYREKYSYTLQITERLIPKIHTIAKPKEIPMIKVIGESLNGALAKIKIETLPCEVKEKWGRYQTKKV